MKLTKEDVLKLWKEQDCELDSPWIQKKDGDWSVDHKYQNKEDVFYNPETEQWFEISQSRSGSYFTEYEYGESQCYEVEPFEVTTTHFKLKK